MTKENKKNRDYGFIINKLDDGPMSTRIINNISSIIQHRPYDQICIFNSYNERISHSTVPIFHLNESKFFYGNLFIFDIASAIISQTYPNISKRYFYATNIPWERNTNGDYKEWSEIFHSSNIEIIAQNQYISDIYEICWKKPLLIAEDFSYEHIKSIME